MKCDQCSKEFEPEEEWEDWAKRTLAKGKKFCKYECYDLYMDLLDLDCY